MGGRRRVGRRIFGIETEFGLAWRGAPDVDVDEVGRVLFEPMTAEDETTEEFLPNGARVYLDMGTHPEYATGECDDLVQLVTHDKAGERVLDALALRAERRLAAAGSPGRIYLFKNNTDFSGNGYGSHENYLVSRRVSLDRLAAVLVPFLVTRQLICGAGAVRPTRRGARYCLSQRAPYIGEDVSDATTQQRPIVNTRDEPHADPRRYRRLHLVVGDSTMSELTTFLKIGATHLVLDMVEGGTAVPELYLADPVAAIRAVSRDTTGTRPVKLADGRSMSALDLQRTYRDRAAKHLARRGEEPDLVRVLALWSRVLDAVARRDPAAIDRQIDWAIKQRLIEHYRARHGLPLDSPRVARLDLAYHDIRPGRGLFDLLQRAGLAERVTDDRAIEEAVDLAPQTTRARLRGEFVTAAHRAHRDVSIDWTHLTVDDSGRPPLACRDPFRAADPRVDRLIATLDRA